MAFARESGSTGSTGSTRRGGRAGVAAKLAVVALALTLAAASAAERPEETADADLTAIHAAGAAFVFNAHEGQAILSAAGMRPGSTAIGTVTIRNTGNERGSFALGASSLTDIAGPRGGLLSERLEIVIQQTAAGSTTTLYSGKLRDLPVLALPGAFAPGESRDYEFTVRFPDGGRLVSSTAGDNAYQGATTSLKFDWGAKPEGSTTLPPASPPPTPAQKPSPAPSAGAIEQPPPAEQPPATDDAPPATAEQLAKVEAPRTWSVGRRRDLRIAVECGAECDVFARARLSGSRALRKLKLRVVQRSTAAGDVKLAVRLDRKGARLVHRALRARTKVSLAVTVQVTNDAGDRQSFRRVLGLKL